MSKESRRTLNYFKSLRNITNDSMVAAIGCSQSGSLIFNWLTKNGYFQETTEEEGYPMPLDSEKLQLLKNQYPQYFKTIVDVLQYVIDPEIYSYHKDIPKAHWESCLHNFRDDYGDGEDEFWVKLRETTEKMMTLPIEESPRYIFLCGGPGAGKSHYSIGLYKKMVWRRKSTKFETFNNALDNMGMRWTSSKDYNAERMPEYYKQYNRLFLDDFTAADQITVKDSNVYRFFKDIIINTWENQRTLVTSTNFESDNLLTELSKMFDGYVMSRLVDPIIIQFPDQDNRKRKLGSLKS